MGRTSGCLCSGCWASIPSTRAFIEEFSTPIPLMSDQSTWCHTRNSACLRRLRSLSAGVSAQYLAPGNGDRSRRAHSHGDTLQVHNAVASHGGSLGHSCCGWSGKASHRAGSYWGVEGATGQKGWEAVHMYQTVKPRLRWRHGHQAPLPPFSAREGRALVSPSG